MRTIIVIGICAASLCAVDVAAAEKAAPKKQSYQDQLQALVSDAREAQKRLDSGQPVTTRTLRKGSRATTEVLDISDEDFKPGRRRRPTPSPDTTDQATEAPSAPMEEYVEEYVESTPVPPLGTRRPTLRNVGYRYDSNGDRIYEDGSVTDQSGRVFKHYGSGVRYE